MGEIIFFMFIGMLIGVIVLCWMLEQGVRKMKEQNDIVDQALEMYKQYIIKLKVEKVNDIFYLYNLENDEFVCQGADYAEVKKNFELRYPDHGSYIRHQDAHHFPEAVKEQMKKIANDGKTRTK